MIAIFVLKEIAFFHIFRFVPKDAMNYLELEKNDKTLAYCISHNHFPINSSYGFL